MTRQTKYIAVPAGSRQWPSPRRFERLRAGVAAAFIVTLLAIFGISTMAYAIGGTAGGRHTHLPTASGIIQQKLQPLEASSKARQPVFISGKTIVYDRKLNLWTVSGQAKVTEGPTTVTANTIKFRNGTKVHALGNVHLTDPSSNIYATEGTLDLTTEEATMYHARVAALDNSYYLTGSKLTKTLGQNYHAENATITTCTCNSTRPDWSLSAKQMNLTVNGMMTGTDGQFNILNREAIPLPYLEYNTSSERHSGFLSPSFSYSTLRGFTLLEPYYIDLAPNQDITIAGDFESSARAGALLEYRRVDGKDDFLQFTTSYYNESFRSDANRQSDIVDPQIANPTIPINRWGIVGLMEEHLTPDLYAYGTATSSGDSLFFREAATPALSGLYGWNTGNWLTTREAVSDLGLHQSFDNSYMQLGGVWNQDLIQPQRFALQTLPGYNWNGYQNLANGLAYLTYTASAVDYWRQEGVDGYRVDADPQLTIPLTLSHYLDGWVTGGFDATGYDVSGHEVKIIPVGTHGRIYNNNLALGPLEQGGLMGKVVPDVDAGVRTAILGRSDLSSIGLGKITTLTVPTVEYQYIPPVDQTRFPLFDETDRINARSIVFYGFSTRIFMTSGSSTSEDLTATNNSNSIARGLVGPSFSTESGRTAELLRFSVEEAYDTHYQIAPDGARLSDIAAGFNVFPNRLISGVTSVDWSPRSPQGLDAASFGLQFQPPGQSVPNIYIGHESIGSYLQISYTYAAPNAVLQAPSSSTNATSMVTARAYTDLTHYFGAYFAPVYDVDAHRLLDDIIGVRLKSACDCWFLDLGFTQTYNPNDTTVSFQVTLGGLGSIGEAPFGLNPFQAMGLLPMARAPEQPTIQAPSPEIR